MKLTTILTILPVGQFLTSAGQNFRQQFNDLCNKKDTAGQEKILTQWKVAMPNDPELYVAYYNFYVQKSMTEMLRLDKNVPKGKEALQLMNTDTTKKEPAGFMFSEIYYKPEILSKGYAYIDTAIQKFNDRLDMRFGKIYMPGKTTDYEQFTTEIIKTIEYSNKNKNAWLWTDNIKIEKPKEFFLGSIQNYVNQLYNTGDDALLDNMKRIAETVLKFYPDHVESLSNISIACMVNGDFDSALTPLLKAEKISPKDYIVLNNIAHCYTQKGDKKNAIKYYELTVKYGDKQAKEFANQKLTELKK